MWHSILLIIEGFALGVATTFLSVAIIQSRRAQKRMHSTFSKKELSRLSRFGS